MTIDIAVGGFLIALASFLIGQRNGAKIDGEKQGQVFTKLKYIEQDVRELKNDFKLLNIETMRSDLESVKSRLDRHSESIRRGHQRIDNHLRNEHMMKVEERDDGEED